MTENNNEYVREVDVYVLDYEIQGEKWLKLLNEELAKRIAGINGWSISFEQPNESFKYSHRKLVLSGMVDNTQVPIETPNLKIMTGQTSTGANGLYLVLGWDREIDDTQYDIWNESIDEATSKLDLDDPEFLWTAVLGQAKSVDSQEHYSLSSTVTIDDITIKSSRGSYIYHEQSEPPYFGGRSFGVTWPILIEGNSRGYEWNAASAKAAEQTQKMAVLISIAWNSTWVLLHAPTPTRDLKVPESDNPHAVNNFNPFTRKPKKIPTWLSSGWDLLETDKRLRDAASVYYEGLRMYEAHPSFAYVAFTAVIETIGKIKLGGGTPVQKFQAGLASAELKPEQSKELEELYSSRRSETVHAGGLHGGEDSLGSIHFPGLFQPSPSGTFKYTDLLLIRAASRKLLIRALKGKV